MEATDNGMAEIAVAVDSRRDEILASLMEAVRIPTQTPPGENYDAIVDLYKGLFASLGYDARRIDVPEALVRERVTGVHPDAHGVRANLVATKNVPTQPGMAFYCHLDTTQAGDRSQWSGDPFQPRIEDGFVVGRGTADSKGGCTAIYWGLRVIEELRLPLAVSPLVALTTDEELGPYTGMSYLAEQHAFDECRFLYSADGMSNSVAIGCQGTIKWTIRIEGKSCHSSTPFMGLNPIEHGVPLMDDILRLKREVESRRSRLKLSPELRHAAGRDHVAPALNITVAKAGWRPTAIPPDFVLSGDRRYMPEEDVSSVVAELQNVVERARERDRDLRCTLELAPSYTPFANDPDDAWVERVCRLATRVRGSAVEAAALSGGTDVADVVRFSPHVKIAIHGLADFEFTRNHAPDERCRIADLLNQVKIVASLASGRY